MEALFIAPLLLQGYNLVIPDTEGQQANFAAGPEYGTNTLDSIRAATKAAETGLDSTTSFGLIGYSGGAIATNWAATLAPSYAPDVNRRLVGYAEGGLLVDPAHNLKYVDGSLAWSGVIPMAVIGVSRSYGIDLKSYLNSYGLSVYKDLERGSIINALGHYPGLTWKKMAKPEYANPNSIPAFLTAMNKLNLGSAATPAVPGFIGQGNGGVLEGTFSNRPGIGTGDGVMVARRRALTRPPVLRHRRLRGQVQPVRPAQPHGRDPRLGTRRAGLAQRPLHAAAQRRPTAAGSPAVTRSPRKSPFRCRDPWPPPSQRPASPRLRPPSARSSCRTAALTADARAGWRLRAPVSGGGGRSARTHDPLTRS